MFVIASRRSAGRVPRMVRSAISAFTRVFDAPSARSRASSARYAVRC
jgi:hypothetical protein